MIYAHPRKRTDVIKLPQHMNVSFVSNPSPVLLDDGGQPYGPIRTNFFPHPQVTLASCLDPNRYKISLLDLRTISDPTSWQSEIGQPYARPIHYGEINLRRHLVGNYKERIEASDPDVDIYVLSANFTCEAGSIKQTIQQLKKHNPGACILVGGRDAAALERHQFYLDAGADYIGIGDADLSLPRFLDNWAQGNLAPYRDKIIGPISVPHTDMPYVDLNFINSIKHRFTESGGGSFLDSLAAKGFAAYIETSRGCPRECPFCCEARSAKTNIPIDRVIEQIDHFISVGVGTFMFSDDNLLARNTDDLRVVFDYLREKNVGWEFPVGVEVNLLTDRHKQLKYDLIDSLFWNNGNRDDFAGLHRLLFPMEDSLLRCSQLRKLKKHSQELVLEELIRRQVPFINITIMIGDPHEQPEERQLLEENLERIFELARNSQTTLNFSVFCTIPLPGTPYKDQLANQGRINYDINSAPELWNVFNSVIQGDHYTPEQVTGYRRELLQKYNMQQLKGKVDPNY